MRKKSKQIWANVIALIHSLLLVYIITIIVWFLITLKLNTYVIIGLVLAVWTMSAQKWLIGWCPLTFLENRLRGLGKQEKFLVRFWGFFGIKIRQEEKTWQILRWGLIGLFF